MEIKVAGIDLAGSEKRPTGICILESTPTGKFFRPPGKAFKLQPSMLLSPSREEDAA
jgi:hypothetical protein